ncbi:MAG: Gram-negative bacterial TonB protein C-terminal, partial [Candidatus Eremiobacteraeota bacterium]|nr:Gram-negative bacterial TonB protein C-terminal [Candidatus Eremiobacteraeota bacterium]
IATLGTLAVTLASTAPTLAAPASASLSTCKTQAASAAISVPVPADYPFIAAEQNFSGTSVIRVDLADTGAIRNTAIFESSGNQFLDRAALLAAGQQTYSPQIVSCAPVGGSYLITVDFQR